ncbi:hypothetical protein [Halorussus salinisoli]|nr:hypothetical protein [Halorussus salinisoli]
MKPSGSIRGKLESGLEVFVFVVVWSEVKVEVEYELEVEGGEK